MLLCFNYYYLFIPCGSHNLLNPMLEMLTFTIFDLRVINNYIIQYNATTLRLVKCIPVIPILLAAETIISFKKMETQ